MGFFIQSSPLGGQGVFATTPISKGNIILTFVGDTMSREEAWNKIEYGLERNDDPLQIGVATYIDLHQPGIYFNHSCKPNALLCNVADLIAIRDIAVGEEITYDYSATVGVDSDWDMMCQCGTQECRKKLGNVLSISKEKLREYRRLGGLQDYIRRELELH